MPDPMRDYLEQRERDLEKRITELKEVLTRALVCQDEEAEWREQAIRALEDRHHIRDQPAALADHDKHGGSSPKHSRKEPDI